MMNEEALLDGLIVLFKRLEKPTIDNSGNRIRCTEGFTLTVEIADAIRHILTICPDINEYSGFTIENRPLSLKTELAGNIGERLDSLKISFPPRESIPAVYFYKDEYELVDTHAQFLSQGGRLPDNYYLTKPEFSSKSGINNVKLEKLDRLLDWFALLKDISSLNSTKEDVDELIFIEKAGDDKLTKPIHFLTMIHSEVLNVSDMPALGHFEELKKVEGKTEIHKKEKQKFLRVAFIEVLRALKANEPLKDDAYLIAANIDRLRNSYYEHLELFMEDFAISEFKREIEEAHFSYIEKIESVIGNIQGKLYAIPASFAAFGAIAKSQTIESTLLIIFGSLLASIFTCIMVMNQKDRAQFVDKSIDFVFDKLQRQNDEEIEHDSIVQNIKNAKSSLSKMLKSKRKLITFYVFASWTPFIAAILVAYFRHRSEILEWVVTVIIEFNQFTR